MLDIDNLHIYTGETTAVIGYSAAGKSTLLNLLGLLTELDDFPCENGSSRNGIRYHDTDFNYDYNAITRRQKRVLRREHFGFIFQSHHLTSHLTARANIMLPLALKASASRVNNGELEQLCARAGFANGEERALKGLPFSLSGGQALRVAVLRALVHSPRVLFADEPTGSLDPKTGQKVMQMITDWRMMEPERRTVILVSHNLHQAWESADRFLLFKQGQLVYDGRKHMDIEGPDLLFQMMS